VVAVPSGLIIAYYRRVLEVDVTVKRRDFTVHAAFTVAPGERVALFGPSGAGKTTVLETIAGLVTGWHGRVAAAGRELPPWLPPWRRRIGLLRQDPCLFPHLTVRENLLYAPGARADELPALAAELGIGGLLGARPAGLSGGQAHRVALARMLLAH
jgi:molybdate transport system ATP-binding protein